jgi:hypothetical protein
MIQCLEVLSRREVNTSSIEISGSIDVHQDQLMHINHYPARHLAVIAFGIQLDQNVSISKWKGSRG